MPNPINNDNRQYRIGEFARRLGVTTEFLKHYEESGLLKVDHRANGYRYYNFDQSARVLEYLRLKNYGLSIKDMGTVLASDTHDALKQLEQKADQMKREVARLEAILAEHDRLQKGISKILDKGVYWEIRDIEPHYFLYHTTAREFIPDEAIYEILNQWTDWIPVTKAAMLVSQSIVPTVDRLHWGFAISQSQCHRYEIPTNNAVRLMTFGKAFVFDFCGLDKGFHMQSIATGTLPAWQTLKDLGLEPTGDALILREMQLDPGDKPQACIGRVIIPIEVG